MTNFMPLFTNINSIANAIMNSAVFDKLQNEYSDMAIPMFTSATLLLAELASTT
jgi:hypothetical protein